MICPPVWLCRCGCGGVTNVIKRNHFKRGRYKGEYAPFLPGHQNRGLTHPETRGVNHWTAKNPVSEETRRKQSEARRGDKHWNWKDGRSANRGKIGNPSGENHWNWRGGITTERHKERTSPEAKAWTKAIFKRDDYTCWDCGKKGGQLNAHHLKSWANYPELRYVLTNGITVCKDPCHKIRTKRDWGK